MKNLKKNFLTLALTAAFCAGVITPTPVRADIESIRWGSLYSQKNREYLEEIKELDRKLKREYDEALITWEKRTKLERVKQKK